MPNTWRLTVAAARKLLIASWFGSFVAALAIVFYLYLDDWIETDNFRLALGGLNSLYAPYLGAITLYYWGKSADATADSVCAGASVWLALTGSIIWNAIVLIFFVPLALHSGRVEDAVENAGYVGGVLSWLVAGAIGYYFANPSSTTSAMK